MKKLFSIMSNLQNPLSLQTRFAKYGPKNVVIVDGVHTQVVSKSYEFLFERPTKSELKFVAGHFICNLREWATGPTVPSITGDTASVFIISVIWFHYNDVTMSAMASQSTNPTIVYSSVYRGTDRKKPSKAPRRGFCAGSSPVSCEVPAQRASNAENVSIWWRHHVYQQHLTLCRAHSLSTHVFLCATLSWLAKRISYQVV